MDQKELYIQYLEDALNHAKTGEPMKRWQVKDGHGWWVDQQYLVRDNLEKMSAGRRSIRIKPEPFKWTTFAYKNTFGGISTGTHKGHINKPEVCFAVRAVGGDVLAVHHHEIETD